LLGPFEEEEQGIGIASDAIKVEVEKYTQGSLMGSLMGDKARNVFKNKSHTI